MKTYIEINSTEYQVDTERPMSIAIPMMFNCDQPNTYNVPKAGASAYRDGQFVGSVAEGGSCNFETYNLIAHCNGTHTECVGHISVDRISVNDILTDAMVSAAVITVNPVQAAETKESYIPKLEKVDLVITTAQIQKAIQEVDPLLLSALIIRTRPNEVDKKTRKYMDKLPPFFTKEAMEYISQLHVKHLLVDMPSVDRTFDDGKMTNHCTFWNVDPKNRNVDLSNCSTRTITEMVFVPDSISDGNYLLQIQIPPFQADAAPSRPVLFNIKERN